MANTMLIGAMVQLLGLNTQVGLNFLADQFAKKGENTIEFTRDGSGNQLTYQIVNIYYMPWGSN